VWSAHLSTLGHNTFSVNTALKTGFDQKKVVFLDDQNTGHLEITTKFISFRTYIVSKLMCHPTLPTPHAICTCSRRSDGKVHLNLKFYKIASEFSTASHKSMKWSVRK